MCACTNSQKREGPSKRRERKPASREVDDEDVYIYSSADDNRDSDVGSMYSSNLSSTDASLSEETIRELTKAHLMRQQMASGAKRQVRPARAPAPPAVVSATVRYPGHSGFAPYPGYPIPGHPPSGHISPSQTMPPYPRPPNVITATPVSSGASTRDTSASSRNSTLEEMEKMVPPGYAMDPVSGVMYPLPKTEPI